MTTATLTTQLRFDRLSRPHLDGLYRFACKLERDPVKAEDLVQQALAVGLHRLSQLRADGAFRVWISQILYRTWQNTLRKKKEAFLEQELIERVESRSGTESSFSSRRLGQQLAEAFGQLPAEQAEAVWLVDAQGFTFAEAADIVEVPPGTMASRVARGRAALRVDLEHVAREHGMVR